MAAGKQGGADQSNRFKANLIGPLHWFPAATDLIARMSQKVDRGLLVTSTVSPRLDIFLFDLTVANPGLPTPFPVVSGRWAQCSVLQETFKKEIELQTGASIIICSGEEGGGERIPAKLNKHRAVGN